MSITESGSLRVLPSGSDEASKSPDVDSSSSCSFTSKPVVDPLHAGVAIDEENGFVRQSVAEPRQEPQTLQLLRHRTTRKYLLPSFTREDTANTKMYLKYHGVGKFLDHFLPEDLNSIYLYHLIHLLGFEVRDKELNIALDEVLDSDPINTDEYEPVVYAKEPLEKKFAVKLIKDLQKAINKVFCTRLRLSDFHTLDNFVQKLHEAKSILVLTGAGVSTSLGIPDFRSSEGFYSKIQHLGLDDPQDVFNLDIFLQDPSVFYNIAHMILPPEHMFSPLHSFIKMLQDKGKLLRNYTQNIDNLESYAGIKAEKLVQCHGSFATASCVTCHWQILGEKIFSNIRNMELPLCPYCYKKRIEYFPTVTDPDEDYINPDDSLVFKSYGVLKPDITFFGEALPSKFHKNIREDIMKCDLLICIGTSLKVAPVSEIVNMVPAHVPQILINRDPVRHAEFDLSLLGFCDDVANLVAQKCSWDIPHKDWDELKKKKFSYFAMDKGVYEVLPKNDGSDNEELLDTCDDESRSCEV